MDRSPDWIRQARRDMEKVASDRENGFYEWACFTAHQAGEKAVKAAFQRLGQAAWGHGLFQLLGSLADPYRPPAQVLQAARRLDAFYIPTRYPDGFPAGAPTDYYTVDEANEAERDAAEIVGFCEGVLLRSGAGPGGRAAGGPATPGGAP